MNYNSVEILKKGYLLFPKALFEEQMKAKKSPKAEGAFEAFVIVLQHVNYSAVHCCIKGCNFDCMRGKSVLSFAHWAQILGWSRNQTRYFFNKMFALGIIEKLVNPYVTHICIPDYELLTGNIHPSVKRQKDVLGEDFETFWQKYHEVTEKPKINIGRARREWKKLSPEEKHLAGTSSFPLPLYARVYTIMCPLLLFVFPLVFLCSTTSFSISLLRISFTFISKKGIIYLVHVIKSSTFAPALQKKSSVVLTF